MEGTNASIIQNLTAFSIMNNKTESYYENSSHIALSSPLLGFRKNTIWWMNVLIR